MATSQKSPNVRLFGGVEVTRTQPTFAQQFLERAELLHLDVTDLQRDTESVKRAGAGQRLAELQAEEAKRAPAVLLKDLSALGLAWRDVARILRVSVPAIQKWRRGENVTASNRSNLSRLSALMLLAETYLVSEPASWLEIPVMDGTPITGLDLLAAGRFDLVLELMGPNVRREDVLDEFTSDWRNRSPGEEFESYQAADGQVSIRTRQAGGTAELP
ncbi:MAG: hypothetical protein LBT54_04175 [Bifidobacteriaceae bacterium]|jgi:hypothetical protein|nr:hypothetical protein [Bifidobacteriaceae bacterium]